MNTNQELTILNTGQNQIHNDYKVIEVNVSSSTEGLYAVCTPVKIKDQCKILWEK
ncbi:hypothetical protein R4Z10_12570 [Niallia sp. XMNu-256]|uniref:hypothetical protein n=1 Tax=Niallia sp. XMNu-256 TaxID=3082444 RepID=UPI0030D5906E